MDTANHGADRRGRLYLARHGRTALNARGQLRGRLDPDLDDVGRVEALLLGDVLARSGGTVVVSSPLCRALETAEAIASCLGAPVRTDPRLTDRDYGRWAGWTIEEIAAEWGSVDDAPGVEPGTEVRTRALEALGDIWRTHHSPSVAVSHDAVNRAILCALDPSLCTESRISQPTGCVNIIDWDDRTWSVVATGLLPRDAKGRIAQTEIAVTPNERAAVRT
jgi:probable phosphoglycerate mutase